MSDTRTFALLVLLTAGCALLAVLSNRLTERLKVPAPALFLVAAAVAVKAVPSLHTPPQRTVERLVTVALVLILFDGGMHIGASRLREALSPIVAVGVLGTFLTAGAAAVLVHLAFGLSWFVSLLLATAVSPTDPAVVFSVLGGREIAGRSGTILEGESGANDPVGIALMASLITAGGVGAGAFVHIAGEFVLEMAVGGLLGVVGGRLLLRFMRSVPLPSEALYPLRTLFCVFALYGAATLAHGSGFLAVFVAGILIGDARAPYKLEVERFHSSLASFGEVLAFVVLGLTVDVSVLAHADVWWPGLVLAAALALVIRPVLVGLTLLPWGLARNESAFVLFAGLKGAVPILLGSFILQAGVPGGTRVYGIVVVVVVLSVLLQGGLVPAAVRLLHLPVRMVEPEPWALGVRLRDEPEGVHRVTIGAGSPADGSTIAALADLPESVWVSLVVRRGELVAVRGDTRLRAGDEVLVLSDPASSEQVEAAFERPRGG